jgi:hypothetical protein
MQVFACCYFYLDFGKEEGEKNVSHFACANAEIDRLKIHCP